MINEKVESGNQLKRQLKFDDSIYIYKTALKTAKNYFNPNKKNSEIKILFVFHNFCKDLTHFIYKCESI